MKGGNRYTSMQTLTKSKCMQLYQYQTKQSGRQEALDKEEHFIMLMTFYNKRVNPSRKCTRDVKQIKYIKNKFMSITVKI